jgi:multidrug efflux pump subunit AcrB
MIRYFAAHPTAANILMICIILLGLTSISSLNKETFPQLKSVYVGVNVPYPGASPSDVEEGICNRLEDATDGIVFLSEQRCAAQDNIGTLTLIMQEAGDLKQFKDDVQAAVDSISDFPNGVEDITVKELNRLDTVLILAITADLPRSELKALAEYYRRLLLKIPQIPIVEVIDFPQHEYSIRIKPEILRAYKLGVQDIANLIKAQSLDMPAGVLYARDKSYQIRVENLRRSKQELEDLTILNTATGGQLRLGDIATIEDKFENTEKYSMLNGVPSAQILISKNKQDDTLTIYNAVSKFVKKENAKLPKGTRLIITRDAASVVKDRLNMLTKNGWQGLVLATFALFLFFSWRYTVWVAAGLPVSFLGGLVLMSIFGVSINMISMIALLMAIGILMDDAIVLSESIEAEYRTGKSPLQAALDGTEKVIRGVISSFITSVILFGSLLFLKGEMGQIMGVLPVVLLSVLTISLIEAFLILPHHLSHSLILHSERKRSRWRKIFDTGFDKLRHLVGKVADISIKIRYLVVGGTIALLIVSFGLMTSGIVKFKGFPSLEGNLLEARIIMPQGTPFKRTKEVVQTLVDSLTQSLNELPKEPNGKLLVKNTQIFYSKNSDANEQGAHLATISLDLLDAETRHTSLAKLKHLWRKNTPLIPDALSIQFKEPMFGPSGQAISIRLQGDDLNELSQASWELQNWLKAYKGTFNIMDDLRLGKPQFIVSLLPGSLQSGIDAQQLSAQLRAAYQGIKVNNVYRGREAYEVNVKMDSNPDTAIEDFEQLTVFSKKGEAMPLSAVAEIKEEREFSRVMRINHQRTITVSGDIDMKIANTREIIKHTRENFLSKLKEKYPKISFGLEGEVKKDAETSGSIFIGFILGIIGIYLLLSLQFQNYKEPIVVLLNIPLALIGVIWGHLFMGLDMSLPSMIGFVAMAGVVVNDSILLVEFVKIRTAEGMSLHKAAGQAVRDRFRAVFLTSVTTIAGMIPMLSETSLQAQVLVPLVTSVVFGMLAATFLIILVLPASYAILEDMGFVSHKGKGAKILFKEFIPVETQNQIPRAPFILQK